MQEGLNQKHQPKVFFKKAVIVWKGVSVPLSFSSPLLDIPPFFRNMQPPTPPPAPVPSWHPSWENPRFYDDTPESGRLKKINIAMETYYL